MAKGKVELLKKLDRLAELVVSESQLLRSEFKSVRSDFKHEHPEFKSQGERIAYLEGRMEEQSRILQVALAGCQPRKPAA
jgi:hypothetical protein